MAVRRCLPLLAAVLTWTWLAPLALAHAHYVSSNPDSGAQLSAAPARVTSTFDDDLDPNTTTITVLGPQGATVSTGGTTVSIEAPKVASVAIADAGSGSYTVMWHAVADDDKGVTEGRFAFAVGSAGRTTAQPASNGAARSAAPAVAPATLPSSGGGGLARHDAELQAGACLTVALLVALLVTPGARRRPEWPRTRR